MPVCDYLRVFQLCQYQIIDNANICIMSLVKKQSKHSRRVSLFPPEVIYPDKHPLQANLQFITQAFDILNTITVDKVLKGQ